jgi:hypothetical protein
LEAVSPEALNIMNLQFRKLPISINKMLTYPKHIFFYFFWNGMNPKCLNNSALKLHHSLLKEWPIASVTSMPFFYGDISLSISALESFFLWMQ